MNNSSVIALVLAGIVVAGAVLFVVNGQKSTPSNAEGPSGSGPILALNDSNFDAEIAAHKGWVLIDFSATWCGPCRQLAPIVDAFAKQYEGRVYTAKVDVDQSPKLAQRYKIDGIPFLLLMKDGTAVDQKVGGLSAAGLKEWVDSFLKK